jgi:hypothetical protein
MLNVQVIGANETQTKALKEEIAGLEGEPTEESIGNIMKKYNLSGNIILDQDTLMIQINSRENLRQALRNKIKDREEERNHFNDREWRMYRAFGGKAPSPLEIRRRRKEYEPLLMNEVKKNQMMEYIEICLS